MEADKDAVRRLLEEIRDHQKALLDQSREMMELSTKQFELVRKQHERAERIQERAEVLQSRSEGLVGGARKAFLITIPILVALLIYVSWLLFGLIL